MIRDLIDDGLSKMTFQEEARERVAEALKSVIEVASETAVEALLNRRSSALTAAIEPASPKATEDLTVTTRASTKASRPGIATQIRKGWKYGRSDIESRKP
jgi:hypothetical protein